jgi:glycosyltransferase involved in cell wall biosynthesis
VNALLRRLLLWADLPDEFVGWLPFALTRGWQATHALEISAIYASGPPFSVVLAGVLLARLTGRPLIADFRDAWTLDAQDPFGTLAGTFRNGPDAARLSVLRSLEAHALERSSRILFTSRSTERTYLDAYPTMAGRTAVIFNGVDPDDFDAAPRFSDVPSATHVGTIHEYQVPQVLALLEAVAAGRIRGGSTHFRIDFVGPMSSLVRARIAGAAERLDIASRVHFHGTVTHHESIGWVRGADVLLLFCGLNPIVRLSKLSEYAASGRPMLAFAVPGAETALEVQALGGDVTAGDDAAATFAALHDLLRRGIETRALAPVFPFAHPHPLNRRTETAQLAQLLDEVVACARA